MAEEMDVEVDRPPIPLVSLMEGWADGPILIYVYVCMYLYFNLYINPPTCLYSDLSIAVLSTYIHLFLHLCTGAFHK